MLLPDTALLEPRRRRLILILTGALILATFTWMGYAFGRGQSLADVARLYRDASLLRFTLSTPQLVALYDRTGGDSKPLISTVDGTILVDYSDWDYAAAMVVDGRRYELVRLVPTASADYARNRISSGLSSGDWVLAREVALEASTASVSYSLLANRPLHDVQITIAHTNWYYFDAKTSADGYTAGVPRGTRKEVETGVVNKASLQITLAITSDASHSTQVDRSTPFGVESIVSEYRLKEPQVGQYVPVTTERITWRALP